MQVFQLSNCDAIMIVRSVHVLHWFDIPGKLSNSFVVFELLTMIELGNRLFIGLH
jgi:hypothetical protein